MNEQRLQGVAALKKHDIKVSGIVFMLYCLVAAGAFGIEEMIPDAGPGMTIILLCVFPFVWRWMLPAPQAPIHRWDSTVGRFSRKPESR